MNFLINTSLSSSSAKASIEFEYKELEVPGKILITKGEKLSAIITFLNKPKQKCSDDTKKLCSDDTKKIWSEETKVYNFSKELKKQAIKKENVQSKTEESKNQSKIIVFQDQLLFLMLYQILLQT